MHHRRGLSEGSTASRAPASRRIPVASERRQRLLERLLHRRRVLRLRLPRSVRGLRRRRQRRNLLAGAGRRRAARTRPTCTSDGSACGGTCDGSTRDGCSYPVGDVCRGGSCDVSASGAVAVVEATCQGNGRCPAAQSQSCGQYDCTADGEQCNGDCADDADACAACEYCSPGVCAESSRTARPALAKGSARAVSASTAFAAAPSATAGARLVMSRATRHLHAGQRLDPRRARACHGGGPCGATCDGRTRDSCGFPTAGAADPPSARGASLRRPGL